MFFFLTYWCNTSSAKIRHVSSHNVSSHNHRLSGPWNCRHSSSVYSHIHKNSEQKTPCFFSGDPLTSSSASSHRTKPSTMPAPWLAHSPPAPSSGSLAQTRSSSSRASSPTTSGPSLGLPPANTLGGPLTYPSVPPRRCMLPCLLLRGGFSTISSFSGLPVRKSSWTGRGRGLDLVDRRRSWSFLLMSMLRSWMRSSIASKGKLWFN